MVYHFVDPDLELEMFFTKEGAAEKGGVDFKTGLIHFCKLVLDLKKISCGACLLFIVYFFW